ncbi:MAG: hypothetical protein RSE32_03150 [Comamonas sp.]|uniref:hypothetical protein n=1 Tax=Comamonas sp. TaxID=34028 RepID=UPI002FC970C7
MSTTSHTLGAIAIPSGLIWVDEYNWVAPVRVHEYSITGALIEDIGTRQAGRPITLQGSSDHGWVERDTLEELWQLVNATTGTQELTMADGRAFAVRFAPDDPVSAIPIVRAELPAGSLPYIVTLRLVTA